MVYMLPCVIFVLMETAFTSYLLRSDMQGVFMVSFALKMYSFLCGRYEIFSSLSNWKMSIYWNYVPHLLMRGT